MIKAEITGTIKDIRYRGSKSCIFIVQGENGNDLQCTIVLKHIELSSKVIIGDKCLITGDIRAYYKHKSDRTHCNNVFYVRSIEKVGQRI